MNGGIPQHGNLSLHLAKFRVDFNALVPDPLYRGYCLLDYEFFRADWNSTWRAGHAGRRGRASGWEGAEWWPCTNSGNWSHGATAWTS